jgi:hypothetical protein
MITTCGPYPGAHIPIDFFFIVCVTVRAETISIRTPNDIVNAINRETPNLYQGFTKQQFEEAVRGLQSANIEWPNKNIKTERYFDLDLAKLLCVPFNSQCVYPVQLNPFEIVYLIPSQRSVQCYDLSI